MNVRLNHPVTFSNQSDTASKAGKMDQEGKVADQSKVMESAKNMVQTVHFNDVLTEAVAAAYGAATSNQVQIDKKKRLKGPMGNNSIDDALGIMAPEGVYMAQAVAPNNGVVQNALNAQNQTLNRVPLQLFLDAAVSALNEISVQEYRVNDLIEGFVAGTVSEDDVIIETAKLNLAMSMITTIMQSAVQTFKEIQQIAV
ncbi:MAG: hypothetical protein O3A01_05275 [bacterium]|nr:hypothetical protein [bacterium]